MSACVLEADGVTPGESGADISKHEAVQLISFKLTVT